MSEKPIQFRLWKDGADYTTAHRDFEDIPTAERWYQYYRAQGYAVRVEVNGIHYTWRNNHLVEDPEK